MASFKISEVYPEYVFQRIGAGKDVDGVDFKRKTYVDLDGLTVGALQQLIVRAKNTGEVKFYQFDEVEEAKEGNG